MTERIHKKFALFKLIHFSDAMIMSPAKPMRRLMILIFVIFSCRKIPASTMMRMAFDLCAITAFPTVVIIKPRFRRYILRAFAPEIVRISRGLNRIFFISLLCVARMIAPVMIVGTSNRKKVCWLVGRSRVFTNIPLSHHIAHAQRRTNMGIYFLFIHFFIIFFSHYSTL